MGKLRMYGYYFMNFLTRGARLKKGEIAADALVTKYNSVLTRRYTRKIIVIKKFPTLDVGNPMARIIRSELVRKFPGVKVFIHIDSDPKNINIKDLVYLRRYAKAEERFYKYQEEFESMTGSEKVTGKQYRGPNGRKFIVRESDYKKERENFRSYKYVTESLQNREFMFFDSFYFVELLIPDDVDVNLVLEEVGVICDKGGVIYEIIEAKTSQFLDNFSLTSTCKTKNKFPSMLFSSENLALNSSFMSPGLVGGYGILHGINKLSGLPLIINYFNSGGAKVGMIMSESGGGKTFLAFFLALQFIADGIHCSVIDIKGGEWIALKAFGIKCIEIDMSSKSGNFVNLMRLDDIVTPTTSYEDLVDYLDMAKVGTVQLLSTMVDIQPDEGHPMDVEAILRDAVSKVFSKLTEKGFNEHQPKTYHLTSSLTYKMVIDEVREFGKHAVSNKEDAMNYDAKKAALCRLIIQRCSMFIDDASSNCILKNEITLGQVLDSELVIYSMGKNSDSQTNIVDTVRVFMIQYLDVKKHNIRKKKSLHTVAYYEELQRCGDMHQIVKFISAMVTGGRSNNLAIFLLLNAISTFDNEAFAPIRSNITLYLIGKIKGDDINSLCDNFDCEDMREYLYSINPNADKNLTEEERSKKQKLDFGNSFAIKFRVDETTYDKTIFRLELPAKFKTKLKTTTERKEDFV